MYFSIAVTAAASMKLGIIINLDILYSHILKAWWPDNDSKYPHDGRANYATYTHGVSADKWLNRQDSHADSQCNRYWLSAHQEYEIF